METLIDLFELQEPVVETYRDSYRAEYGTPRPSYTASVDARESGQDLAAPSSGRSSERSLRARLWATED
jgi:hypothetical protein